MNAVPQRRTFLSNPLALLAVCFACGIVLARFVALPLMPCFVGGLVLSVLAAICLVRGREGIASLLVAVAFLSAGAALAIVEKRGVVPNRVQRLYDEGSIASGDPVEVTGTIERAPEPAPDGLYLTLKVEKLRFKETDREVTGVVWLFAPVRDRVARAAYEELELRYGARISVMTALRRAESFRNPGVSSFTEYLERQGYDATGTIKSPLLVERLDDERVFLPLAWVYGWRQSLLAEIDARFNAETGGVLKAALLGNRYHLSRGASERFRQGGTFHILVISGLHISFIGGLMFLVMRRLTKRRAWQFAASVLFLWMYALAVGAESSVVRAALMFTIVALAPLVHRRARSMNALGAACLFLLIWRPSELFDPSFQLTFLSVLAIIAVAWPLLQRLEEIGAWRPTRDAPHPPLCARWLRLIAEALFWKESEWKREMAHAVYSYRLFKTHAARRLERWHLQAPLRYAASALVVSASVQVLLLPLLVLYFHRLSISSLILNIGVGALMALLSLVSLLALLLAQLSNTLAWPFVRLAEGLNWLMVHSVDPFESMHLASIRLPEYQGWPAAVYLLYYVPLVVLIIVLARWRPVGQAHVRDESVRVAPRYVTPLAALALACLSAIIVFHPWSAARAGGRLRVDFLDVGQGDSALVTMPDGTTMLVDGGGRTAYQKRAPIEGETDTFERDTRSIGEMVVSEYLWWRGLDQIDYLVATHADADHMDGLNEVIRNFRVRAAFVARAPADDSEFARFSESARENGVPLYLIGRGDVLHFGEARADVLWPERTESKSAPSRNDDSVVLRLSFGERRFLLTGDVEKNAEAALLAALDNLHSDVVKVAHHGSKTSSTEGFVKAVEAKYAVISVGLYSIFGHPHAGVLERWQAAGTNILVTGRRGTITFTTDGRDLQLTTFVSD